MRIGLSGEELQALIERRMVELDAAQEDEEHLGAYGDLLRTAAAIAYQRAAELILANNRRLAWQLEAAGISIGTDGTMAGADGASEEEA